MLRKLRLPRPSHGTVVAYMALFVALGGTAYAVNTVGSADIIDGQVKSVDIGDGEVGSADVKDNSLNTFDVHSFLGVDVVDETLTGVDIKNGSLKDEDVGQGSFVNFRADIGVVATNSCKTGTVSGVNSNGDHLLLTPNSFDTQSQLIYSIDMADAGGSAFLKTCNPTTSAIDGGSTHFNLLVFDAG
jgi:hypothetical protein